MSELFLDLKGVKKIKSSVKKAIEDGDLEALRDSIIKSFNEDQIEEIEPVFEREGVILEDMLDEMLEEWSGDDIDELFELMEEYFDRIGVELIIEDQDDDEMFIDDEEDYSSLDDDYEGGEDEDEDEDDEDEEDEDEEDEEDEEE